MVSHTKTMWFYLYREFSDEFLTLAHEKPLHQIRIGLASMFATNDLETQSTENHHSRSGIFHACEDSLQFTRGLPLSKGHSITPSKVDG